MKNIINDMGGNMNVIILFFITFVENLANLFFYECKFNRLTRSDTVCKN